MSKSKTLGKTYFRQICYVLHGIFFETEYFEIDFVFLYRFYDHSLITNNPSDLQNAPTKGNLKGCYYRGFLGAWCKTIYHQDNNFQLHRQVLELFAMTGNTKGNYQLSTHCLLSCLKII